MKFNIDLYNIFQKRKKDWNEKQGGFFMRKILSKTQKVELNTFIEQFVKTRQKYFIPKKEWLEANLAGEEISAYIDKKELEGELDELIRNSLEHGQVLPLKMQIQVRKTKDGAEICYLDNGTGNWRNKKIAVVCDLFLLQKRQPGTCLKNFQTAMYSLQNKIV